ncbi:hypothetical protein D2T29_12445 [Sinirhodobacter populi]|uniref:Uncharacterized protein n=1 Tax=Paenirhodobacter populi TaxID=2306993 RepID=A0A443KCG3_9RHOB|nr:hypothetical protein [Sinirhodobacter populi]RWR30474.1 hypothetical protein D2T29_12445 [Sinirhodobacter populi]
MSDEDQQESALKYAFASKDGYIVLDIGPGHMKVSDMIVDRIEATAPHLTHELRRRLFSTKSKPSFSSAIQRPLGR